MTEQASKRPEWIGPWHLLMDVRNPTTGEPPYLIWERPFRREDGKISIDVRSLR